MIQSKTFHEFLSQPALGFRRGVLPYNLLLLLPFVFFAQHSLSQSQEIFCLLFLFCPILRIAHEIIFRHSRLPQPVASSYDALIDDMTEEVSSKDFSDLANLLLGSVVAFLVVALRTAFRWFWLAISLACIFANYLWALRLIGTRFAQDADSIRRFLLLSQSHSIRAPSVAILY